MMAEIIQLQQFIVPEMKINNGTEKGIDFIGSTITGKYFCLDNHIWWDEIWMSVIGGCLQDNNEIIEAELECC